MSVVDEFYVIKVNMVGKPLYAANAHYTLYPSTSRTIYGAYKFYNEEAAKKCVRKIPGGKICKYRLVDATTENSEDEQTEVENLKAVADELKRQRDEAWEQLKIFKEGMKDKDDLKKDNDKDSRE